MVIERSLLFVPGDDYDAIERARDSEADTVIVDLEDTVGPSNKMVARQILVELLSEWTDDDPNLNIRINGLGTPYGIPDLKTVTEAEVQPNAMILPAIRSQTDIRIIDDLLNDAGSSVAIVPLVEHPRAVFNAYKIATATPRIKALAFGSVDFQLNNGISIFDLKPEIHLPRYVVSMAASAAGIHAFDTVFLDKTDTEALQAEALEAKSMGYDGKLAIDPAQIDLINNVFSPTSTEIDRARRLVNEFEATEAGVISFEGIFIDRPVVDQQRALLDRSRE